MELLKELSPIVAIISTVIAIIIGVGTLKQRRNEPNEQRFAALETWKIEVDAKLDRDNRKIKSFDDAFEVNNAFQRVALKALKGLVEAVTKSGGEADARGISQEIDEFLLRR